MVLFCLIGCKNENVEELLISTKFTNLSNEHIEGIQLGEQMLDKAFIQKYGTFKLELNDDFYTTKRIMINLQITNLA